MNVAALIELTLGLLVLVLIVVVAAQSSLGPILAGSLLLVVGVPFLVAPAWTGDLIAQHLAGLETFSDFGSNIVGCLVLTGFTGVLVVAGALLLGFGIALAVTRRAGRREEAARALVAVTNPDGMKARWARKATDRIR